MLITEGMKPYFKGAAALGVAAMAFDTWLSGRFGWTISLDMAAVFGLVSLASGLLLVIAAYFWRTGHATLGKLIACAWVPVFAFNVMSNMGVATSNRMTDVQKASIQQAKYDDVNASAKENAANLAMWKAQLAKLKSENAWVASVTADSLRAQHAALVAKADREAKRGGCGPKCDLINDEARAVMARIGAVEQRDDLTKRIEATQALVDKYRAKASTTEAGVSAAANQSTFFAKLMHASLYASPNSDDVAAANESMGMFTALVLAIVSVLLTYVGAYPHLLDAVRDTQWRRNEPVQPLAPRRSEDDKARLDVPAMQPAMQMGFVPPQPPAKNYRLTGQTVQQRLAAIAAGTA